MRDIKIGKYLIEKDFPTAKCIQGTGETEDCNKCCFSMNEGHCNELLCTDLYRKDKKNVYFVKVTIREK